MAKILAKAFIFGLIAVFMLSVAVFAAPVSHEKALRVAEKAGKGKKMKLKHKSVHKKQHKQKKQQTQQAEEPLLYIFQNDDSEGFVLVAGDDVFKPVIGYSENGTYDSLNMPPNFAWYLENIQKEMAFALDNEQEQTQEISNEWVAYAAGDPYVAGTNLIQTKWNQTAPFNNQAPLIGGQWTYTGCVATAMAQIMNYHQHPKGSLTGTIPAYVTRTRGLQIPSANLNNIAFDWANMKNKGIIYITYIKPEMPVFGRNCTASHNSCSQIHCFHAIWLE
jgi:hypothetical protein